MSVDQPAVPNASGDIIRGAIAQQREQSAKANVDLETTLEELRRGVVMQQHGAAIPVTPAAPVDDLAYQRLQLHASNWTSELVYAALLDDDFKQEIGDRAHQILIDQEIIPPDPEPSDETAETTA